MSIVLATSYVAFVIGCAGQLAGVSSGEIGCPAQDIQIVDDQKNWGSRQWVAVCHGERFFCSGAGGGEGGLHISCTQERASSANAHAQKSEQTEASPTPHDDDVVPEGGCRLDSECDGDMVCREHSCIAPPWANKPE